MLPALSELRNDAIAVSLPIAMKFRGLWQREALLIPGPQGWTEFSPFVEYDDVEASTWLKAAIEFGWDELPPLHRDRIRVNATVPAVAPEQVGDVLARFPGCRTAKVKVAESGQTLAEEIERVREVRRILGPEGRIRIDANGKWNLDEAEHAFHALSEFDLEYVEQPCASIEELIELRARTKYMDIPIAADESIRKADDPLRVSQAEAADVFVLKAAPLGGIREVIRIATSMDKPVVVSSALDTSIGIAMGVYAAAALPELNFDCGLGTAALLAADVSEDPMVAENGELLVRRPQVSGALVDRLRVSPERNQWWLERLERCYELLAS